MSGFTTEELTSKVQKALNNHKNGNIRAAVNAYEDVIPLIGGKTRATLCGNLAAIYMAQGEDEKARIHLQSSVDADPENASAHYNLAVLLTTKLDEHGKALKHCAKALKLDRGNYRVHHLMGNIMQNLGKMEEANQYYIKAEEIALELQETQQQQQQQQPKQSSDSTNGVKPVDALSELQVFKMREGDVITAAVDGADYSMQCISQSPLIFQLRNLLSAEECAHIRNRASNLLEKSFVMGGESSAAQHHKNAAVEEAEAAVGSDGTTAAIDTTSIAVGNAAAADGTAAVDPMLYRSSYNAWLHEDEVLLRIQKRIATLLHLPIPYLQQKSEQLQVVKYDVGGQFKVHQDASAFNPRLFTALMYLNNVTAAAGSDASGGETWFPYATGGHLFDPPTAAATSTTAVTAAAVTASSSVEEAIAAALRNYESAASSTLTGTATTTTATTTEVSLRGLKVSPVQGNVIIFFNLLSTGKLDASAVHAGLPVQQEKWVANYWVELDRSLLNDLQQIQMNMK